MIDKPPPLHYTQIDNDHVHRNGSSKPPRLTELHARVSSTKQVRWDYGPPARHRSISTIRHDTARLTPKRPRRLPLPPTCTPSSRHRSSPEYRITIVQRTSGGVSLVKRTTPRTKLNTNCRLLPWKWTGGARSDVGREVSIRGRMLLSPVKKEYASSAASGPCVATMCRSIRSPIASV